MARRLPPRNTYYLCTGKTRQARHRNGKTCDSRYVPSRALDDLVWRDLVALLRHPEMVAEAFRRASVGSWHPQEFQARRERLRQGKASLAQQLERLTEAYLGGIVPLPEYRRRRVEIEARVEALGRQESSLAGEAERLDQVLGLAASLESFCGRVSKGLEGATFDRKRQLVELLIDRVIVTGDQVEIRYVFPTSPKSEHLRFCHLRSDYLHDPATLDDLEPRPGPLDHLQPDRAGRAPGGDPVGHPLVDAVGPDQLQPAESAPDRLEDQLGPLVVLDAGRRDDHRQDQAEGVDEDVPLAAVDLLPRIDAVRAPLSVVLTDWLSMTAAEGWRWQRPSATRRSPRSSAMSRSSVPSAFQQRKYQYTMVQGGRSCGNARHWQPVRLTYSRALTISRRSYLAGRPPGLGAGMKRWTWAHSAWVRSLG